MMSEKIKIEIEKQKTLRISNVAYQIGKFAHPALAHGVQHKALEILEKLLKKEKII